MLVRQDDKEEKVKYPPNNFADNGSFKVVPGQCTPKVRVWSPKEQKCVRKNGRTKCGGGDPLSVGCENSKEHSKRALKAFRA